PAHALTRNPDATCRGSENRGRVSAARMPMATATIIDVTRAASQHARALPPPPPGFRMAARSFLRLNGVDVVWLAVRESRAQTAMICCSDGARSAARPELKIEPGVGAGGAVLLAGQPWHGELGENEASPLSSQEIV